MLKRAAASKGVAGTLVGAGVGAAGYFASAKLAPKVPFLVGRWWATPTALLLIGHLTKRYSQETGQALVGAAGALMGFGYYVNSSTPPPATNTTTTPTAAPAAGIGEAGALVRRTSAGSYGSAGALREYRGNATSSYSRQSEAGALIT